MNRAQQLIDEVVSGKDVVEVLNGTFKSNRPKRIKEAYGYPGESDPVNEAGMQKLASETGLEWGGSGDTRLHFDDEHIYIDASKMKKSEYNRMEKDINKKEIKGNGYTVYATNDVSGYEWWKDAAKDGDDYNYIMIVVGVEQDKIDTIDASKLKSDAEDLYGYFEHYDNISGGY